MTASECSEVHRPNRQPSGKAILIASCIKNFPPTCPAVVPGFAGIRLDSQNLPPCPMLGQVRGSRVMSSPSIIPNDRLDRDFYIVLEDFPSGAAFREPDEGIDSPTLITDLLSGQYNQVLHV